MADAGIKKLVIPRSQLPPVNDDNEYVLRYRIVSDDKNRTSHYSSIFTAVANTIEPVNGNLSRNGNSLIAVWGDENTRPKYDIFVKFDNGTYEYHGTSPIHTYGFVKKDSATINVRVAVQVEGINKTRNAELTIFESSIVSLV
jgi:hypothetical protein